MNAIATVVVVMALRKRNVVVVMTAGGVITATRCGSGVGRLGTTGSADSCEGNGVGGRRARAEGTLLCRGRLCPAPTGDEMERKENLSECLWSPCG